MSLTARPPKVARDADTLLQLLANERRRRVIQVLDRVGTTDIATLADRLAEMECQCRPHEVDSQQRKRVYVSLYQTHLGRLDSAGVIEWNEHDQPEITADSGLHAALEVLDCVAAVQRPREARADDTSSLVDSVRRIVGGGRE